MNPNWIAEVLDTIRTECGTSEKRLKEIGKYLREREKARKANRRPRKRPKS